MRNWIVIIGAIFMFQSSLVFAQKLDPDIQIKASNETSSEAMNLNIEHKALKESQLGISHDPETSASIFLTYRNEFQNKQWAWRLDVSVNQRDNFHISIVRTL